MDHERIDNKDMFRVVEGARNALHERFCDFHGWVAMRREMTYGGHGKRVVNESERQWISLPEKEKKDFSGDGVGCAGLTQVGEREALLSRVSALLGRKKE